MGPTERADARKEASISPLTAILAELDKAPEEMDTNRIDVQAGSMPDHAVSALPAYEKAMEAAWKKGQRNKVRAFRKRLLARAALAAAGLMITAAATFGAASAFRWDGFLKIFHVNESTLTFQSPAQEYPFLGEKSESGENLPPPSGWGEEPEPVEIRLDSAQELYDLSTPGDKAFRPILERYAFIGGNLLQDVFGTMLHLALQDEAGNRISVQVVTYPASAGDSMSAGVTFETDMGSQKTVRLGSDTVITSTNGEINAVQWVLPLGYCHIFGKSGMEDLLEISRLLIGAGLKPV